MTETVAVKVDEGRQQFEYEIKQKFGDLIDYRICKNGDGEYMAWDMQVAWWAWKASCTTMLQAGNAPVTPDCWCHTCRPVAMNDMRFVVCPECGNKRCPRANDHRHECTGSNEPGQVGSAYSSSPRQEMKSALAKGMEGYGDAMQELAKKEIK